MVDVEQKKALCWVCKQPGYFFNGVVHLDCFLAMSHYPIMEVEPIPFPEFREKIEKGAVERMDNLISMECVFHRKKKCGWLYWWTFPSGFKVSAFHSPLLSSLSGLYAEIRITLPEDFFQDSKGRATDMFHRTSSYDKFVLMVNLVESVRK